MGIYLNPGNQNFVEVLNEGNYVDKTMLIDVTNAQLGKPTFKFICVSRPRRFGKSILYLRAEVQGVGGGGAW